MNHSYQTLSNKPAKQHSNVAYATNTSLFMGYQSKYNDQSTYPTAYVACLKNTACHFIQSPTQNNDQSVNSINISKAVSAARNTSIDDLPTLLYWRTQSNAAHTGRF